jgi:hypothetical protein
MSENKPESIKHIDQMIEDALKKIGAPTPEQEKVFEAVTLQMYGHSVLTTKRLQDFNMYFSPSDLKKPEQIRPIRPIGRFERWINRKKWKLADKLADWAQKLGYQYDCDCDW